MTRDYLLNRNQEEQFANCGFLKLSGVLQQDALKAARSAVDEIVARSEDTFGRCADCGKIHPHDFDDPDCGSPKRPYTQLFNCWAQHPAIRALSLSPLLGRLGAELLGCRSIRLFHDHLLIKEPGDLGTSPHVGGWYWGFEGRACTFWIPLVPTARRMGTLRFYGGTHRATYPETGPSTEEQMYEVLDTWLAAGGFEYSEGADLELGDLTIHDKWMVHGTGVNETADARIALVVHVMDADATARREPSQLQAEHAEFFGYGDVPQGRRLFLPQCPIIWVGDGARVPSGVTGGQHIDEPRL